MKVGVVSAQPWGGAGRAACRLHMALQGKGESSTLFVRHGGGDDSMVTIAPARGPAVFAAGTWVRRRTASLNRRYLELGGDPNEPLRLDTAPQFARLPDRLAGYDVVNLHWVADFVDSRSVARIANSVAPVVWTMHDMLPLSGGCHYDGACGGFATGCGCCPKLQSSDRDDQTARTWKRKCRALNTIPRGGLHVVTPSHWLADCVRRSPIFSGIAVSVIPNSIDTDVFIPRDRVAARRRFGIPLQARVILFMSHVVKTQRKGIAALNAALSSVSAIERENILLVSVGSSPGELPSPLAQRHLGEISDDVTLSEIYSAADVVALPSIQDNLPNTMIEALACGTPVVGFATGGIPDFVQSRVTGSLVEIGDIDGLRRALLELIADDRARTQMGEAGRALILRECRPDVQAGRYIDLFQNMVATQ